MPPCDAELREPLHAALHRVRFQIECDGRVHNVMVVDLSQPGKVLDSGGSNGQIRHRRGIRILKNPACVVAETPSWLLWLQGLAAARRIALSRGPWLWQWPRANRISAASW